jgi:hypothetical protein
VQKEEENERELGIRIKIRGERRWVWILLTRD